MTKEDLADLDLWLSRKNDNEEELKVFMEDLEDPENARHLKVLNTDITQTEHVLDIINKVLARRASPACIQRRSSQLNLTTPDYLLKLQALEEEQRVWRGNAPSAERTVNEYASRWQVRGS